MKFHLFNDLPLELQVYILSQNIDILKQSILISSSMMELMKFEYIKKIGSLPLTDNEINTYIKNTKLTFNPSNDTHLIKPVIEKFAFFQFTPFEKKWSTSLFEGHYFCAMKSFYFEYNSYYDNCPTYKLLEGCMYFFYMSANNSIYINVCLFYEYTVSNSDITDDIILDLRSQYNMYKCRLSCQRINPNYAKELILKYFDDIVNHDYMKWSKLSLLAEFQLYIFLTVNARILDITPIIENSYDFDIIVNTDDEGNLILDTTKIESDLEKVKQINACLIKSIKEKLKCL